MMIIELREAAYDKAFELLDEAKHYSKKTKMTLCALEDAVYECYEASKEREEEEYEDHEEVDVPGDEYEESSDMDFRRRYGRRYGYRHDGYSEDGSTHTGMRRSNRRGGIRMRRNRMGRFV